MRKRKAVGTSIALLHKVPPLVATRIRFSSEASTITEKEEKKEAKSLTRWDPFEDLEAFGRRSPFRELGRHGRLGRFVEEMFGERFARGEHVPALDIHESEGE